MPKTQVEDDFWVGLNFDEYRQVPIAPVDPGPAPVVKLPKKPNLKSKLLYLIADVACAVLWVYFFTKLFVIDIDRKLLERFSPKLLTALDYRLAIYLVALILLLIFIKKSWIAILYFLIFPMKMLIWYPAKLIYRKRSWVLFLTIANLVANGIKYIKHHLLSKSILLLGLIMIGFTSNKLLIVLGSLLLMASLGMTIQKVIVRLASGSYFLFSQQELIGRFLNSGFVTNLIKMDDKFKGKRANELTKEDITAIGNSLQMGIVANRLVLLWANQLEKYKKSLSSQTLLFLPYVSLFFSVALVFSLLNLGLYKFGPANFVISSGVTWLKFLYYSFVGLVFGEISGLSPGSNIAILYKIILGVIGILLIAGFILSIAIAWRKQQDSKEFQDQIVALRKQGKKLETRLKSEYGLASIGDAVVLLQKLANVSILGLIDKILPLDLKLLLPIDKDEELSAGPDSNLPSVK